MFSYICISYLIHLDSALSQGVLSCKPRFFFPYGYNFALFSLFQGGLAGLSILLLFCRRYQVLVSPWTYSFR